MSNPPILYMMDHIKRKYGTDGLNILSEQEVQLLPAKIQEYTQTQSNKLQTQSESEFKLFRVIQDALTAVPNLKETCNSRPTHQ